ncbi:MAG: sulfite exporter TauE/SafE family protein [Betaproteobacteria bacterium]
MCGPVCAALLGRSGRSSAFGGGVQALQAAGAGAWWFHSMRVAGYALAGGLVAGGVGLLAWASQAAPLARPVWTLFHVAALALGLWLAITAQQPSWLTRMGRARTGVGETAATPARLSEQPVHWAGRSRDIQAGFAGVMWVAWPCGLLQSALVVAGLANTPVAGAAVMVAFALASAMGLQVAPAFWFRWLSGAAGRSQAQTVNRLMVRLAGAFLALGSLWALGHDVWGQVWAYCFG